MLREPPEGAQHDIHRRRPHREEEGGHTRHRNNRSLPRRHQIPAGPQDDREEGPGRHPENGVTRPLRPRLTPDGLGRPGLRLHIPHRVMGRLPHLPRQKPQVNRRLLPRRGAPQGQRDHPGEPIPKRGRRALP